MNRLFRFIKHLFTETVGAKKSDRFLLSVGVENSRKFGECPGAGLDAKRIHDKVAAGDKILLLSGDATKSAVKSALKRGVAETDDDGLFIFFYSGHGGQVKAKTDKTEDDGKDETLCLYDGELIDNEIWSILSAAKCRVFMVTDCCHSGTNFRSASFFAGKVYAESNSGFRLLHWGGCSDHEYSYGDAAGGVMTNAILSVLSKGYTYKEAFKKVVHMSQPSEIPVKFNLGFDEDVELFK